LIAFDSNILVYAQLETDPQDRHRKANELIAATIGISAIVSMQVLGEFFNVCRRKLGRSPHQAIDQVNDYLVAFSCPQTESQDLFDAAILSDRHGLQFFDALIVCIASRCGAKALLTEDMHDGLVLGDVRIVNPFNPANAEIVADLYAA
jgi:predicted nucleic acid-binding protein